MYRPLRGHGPGDVSTVYGKRPSLTALRIVFSVMWANVAAPLTVSRSACAAAGT